ncbi:hypothetical protein THRCLA_02403 [Thraustotheca clavata]|uniref:Uncharacterized protein n=1 Tax=Thraustotheca clavata TaxID=74557 RepID=A0A1W0A5A8_9STRA|nr:hypothetical protein THRCLA_02403 [Thraustotheca clavata]
MSTSCQFHGCSNTPLPSLDKCSFHRYRTKCKVKECRNQVYARKLCVCHGGKKICEFPFCLANVRTGNFCVRHTKKSNPTCTQEGCKLTAYISSKCIRHGGGKLCLIDDCTMPVHNGNLCWRHRNRVVSFNSEADQTLCLLMEEWMEIDVLSIQEDEIIDNIFHELALSALKLDESNDFAFKNGFPPKEIENKMDDAVGMFLRNNDTVVIEEMVKKREVGMPTRAMTKKQSVVKSNSKNTGKENKRVPKPKFVGKGRVLGSTEDACESEEVEVSSPKKRRKMIQLGSKEDVGIQLLQAVSKQDNSTAGKFFRTATKKAVDHQYEMTLANARLHAALAGEFTVVPAATNQVGIAQMKIRFKERTRTWREETMDMLQPIELKSILKYVLLSCVETGREMIKPFNMAQVSPRVFWNLARMYNGDIVHGIESLLPEEDWSYLGVRTRTLSEKAIAAKSNNMYYRPSTSPPVIVVEDSNEDMEDEELIAATNVEPEVDRTAIRALAAKAALARLRVTEPSPQQQEFTKANTSSPEENSDTITVYCDRCNKARVIEASSDDLVGLKADCDWTCDQLAPINRDGGCSMVDDEILAIVHDSKFGENLEKLGVSKRSDLANVSGDTLFAKWRQQFLSQIMDEDRLENWINLARECELDDFVQKLVGDNDIYFALQELKLATPKDIIMVPTDLIKKDIIQTTTKAISRETIDSWKNACAHAIQQQPWLEDWRSI